MTNRFTVDPADEMLILTTEEGTPIGTATRKECHEGAGKTHWALLAIIKRSNGTIIAARRSSKKSVFPNIWDASVATHVLKGDTPESAAKRETKEELGMDVDFKVIGAYFYTDGDGDYSENEYCTLLIGESDAIVDPLEDEVSEIEELTFAQLQEKIQADPPSYSKWLREAIKHYHTAIEQIY